MLNFWCFRVFQVLCRLTVIPGLSRGISVYFSVVVAWWMVDHVEAVWSSFDANFAKNRQFSAIFTKCLKVPEINSKTYQNPQNDPRGPVTASLQYNELVTILLKAIWDRGNFPTNCRFFFLQIVRKFSINSAPTLTATREGLQKLPHIKRDSLLSFGCSLVGF